MAFRKTIGDDPSKIPVQFNVKIPWDFKKFLEQKSTTEEISQNQLALDALMKAYGREFRRSLASDKPEPEPEPEPATSVAIDDIERPPPLVDSYDWIDPYGDTP